MGKELKPLGLYELDATSLTTSYQELNTTSYQYPVNYLRIINNSNKSIWVSYDGTNSQDFVALNSSVPMKFLENGLPRFLKIYVKGVGAGVGTIAVAAYTIDY